MSDVQPLPPAAPAYDRIIDHLCPPSIEREATRGHARTLQACLRAFASPCPNDAEAHLTDDAIYEVLEHDTTCAYYGARGRQAVIRAAATNVRAVAVAAITVEAIAGDGETLIVVTRERGHVLATGAEFDHHVTGIIRFRGGKVASVRQHVSPGAAPAPREQAPVGPGR